MNFVSLLFVVIAGIAYAVKTTLLFKYKTSRFVSLNEQWWNPGVSHRNKYKNRDKTQGERFWGSTTILVWLTDAYHFFQMVTFTMLALAIVFYDAWMIWWLDLAAIKVLFSVAFEASYRYFSNEPIFRKVRKNGYPANASPTAALASFHVEESSAKGNPHSFWDKWKSAIMFAAVALAGMIILSKLALGTIGGVIGGILLLGAAFVAARTVGN